MAGKPARGTAYATAYYRSSGNFAKVNYKRDTKLRYVCNAHVACLLIMFVSRRLAMPPLRRENVRHATLLFCAEGGEALGRARGRRIDVNDTDDGV